MHKKIESELISIAHGILQMKNKDDVLVLKSRAKEVYEKLAVLAFVDRYLEETPTATETKAELLQKIAVADDIIVEETISDLTTDIKPEVVVAKEPEEEILVEEPIIDISTEPISEVTIEKEPDTIVEADVAESNVEEQTTTPDIFSDDLFSQKVTKEEVKEALELKEKNTLEEELKDTIPLDVSTDIFENAVRVETAKKTLNDTLVNSNLQIDLNDRIAFVKHLFDGSQEEFNRVVSQLNSFKIENEALKFLSKVVKPDYNWEGKETYEDRLVNLVKRKFA